MTTEVHELPEVGEIVVATISKITAHGAYATLDEYNDIQGFLHASEIAHGWVRNINKFVKSGEKKVLLVKRIKEGREEIDLSLKQVSRDQQKKKLIENNLIELKKYFLENSINFFDFNEFVKDKYDYETRKILSIYLLALIRLFFDVIHACASPILVIFADIYAMF